MFKTAINADTTRGFDVMRGRTVLRHCGSYAEAWEYVSGHRGTYVRYYGKRES